MRCASAVASAASSGGDRGRRDGPRQDVLAVLVLDRRIADLGAILQPRAVITEISAAKSTQASSTADLAAEPRPRRRPASSPGSSGS